MKQYILKIVSILYITLVATSCSDYLVLEPEGTLIQDEFWQNKDHVESAVAGCYTSMTLSGFTSKTLVWGELRAEMLVSLRAANNDQNMLKNYMIPSNGLLNWADFYKTINYCNLVLDFADQAKAKDLSFTQAELNGYKGEARAIRALCYFILVRNFKEVPLVLTGTSSNDVDFYPAKNTEDEILEQIISDLKICVSDDGLPVGYSASSAHDKGRFNRGSALTLLADIYLWAGQYEDCVAACQLIIDSGKYELVSRDEWFNEIYFEGNSSEGIFELQFVDISATLRTYFEATQGDVAPFIGVIELYDEVPNDIRGNRATYDLSSATAFKYAGVDADTGLLREEDEFYNNFMFYRYADVLLIQAEALLLIDAPDAAASYANINQVHERATGAALDNSDVSVQGLLEAVLLERQKEFAFEGKRWYDLLRYDRRTDFVEKRILTMAEIKTSADDYEIIISNYTDPESYFLPIYQNELSLNKNLVQNPYYEN